MWKNREAHAWAQNLIHQFRFTYSRDILLTITGNSTTMGLTTIAFYYVPGNMLEAKDKTVSKLGEVPVLMKLYSRGWGPHPQHH